MGMKLEHKRIYAYMFDNLLVLLIILFMRDIIIDINEWSESIENNVVYFSWGETIPKIIIALFAISFAMSFKGETLGKKLFKLKVVKEKEKKELSKKQIFIREGLLKYIPWVITYGLWFYIEIIISLFRRDHRPLHDIIMKTTVMDEKEYDEIEKERNKKKKMQIKTKANIKKKSK